MAIESRKIPRNIDGEQTWGEFGDPTKPQMECKCGVPHTNPTQAHWSHASYGGSAVRCDILQPITIQH